MRCHVFLILVLLSSVSMGRDVALKRIQKAFESAAPAKWADIPITHPLWTGHCVAVAAPTRPYSVLFRFNYFPDQAFGDFLYPLWVFNANVKRFFKIGLGEARKLMAAVEMAQTGFAGEMEETAEGLTSDIAFKFGKPFRFEERADVQFFGYEERLQMRVRHSSEGKPVFLYRELCQVQSDCRNEWGYGGAYAASIPFGEPGNYCLLDTQL